MKFELSHDKRNITNQDLIEDLRRVASAHPNRRFTQEIYRKHGTYSEGTVINRFGTWNAGVEAAGLKIIREQNISEQKLFTALYELWVRLGRQPRYSELTKPLFPYSAKPYEQRFGSWRKALEAFVQYINSEDIEAPSPRARTGGSSPRRTSRSINLRLRFKVLQRDHFRCCACGASPSLKPGILLEVDHIVPWAEGGETELDNLQTLCFPCNQGKSNHHETQQAT